MEAQGQTEAKTVMMKIPPNWANTDRQDSPKTRGVVFKKFNFFLISSFSSSRGCHSRWRLATFSSTAVSPNRATGGPHCRRAGPTLINQWVNDVYTFAHSSQLVSWPVSRPFSLPAMRSNSLTRWLTARLCGHGYLTLALFVVVVFQWFCFLVLFLLFVVVVVVLVSLFSGTTLTTVLRPTSTSMLLTYLFSVACNFIKNFVDTTRL